MHAVMALGNAVTASDSTEFTRCAAIFLNPGTDVSGDAFQIILSRADIIPGVYNSDEWLFKIFVVIAHRTVQAAGQGALVRVADKRCTSPGHINALLFLYPSIRFMYIKYTFSFS